MSGSYRLFGAETSAYSTKMRAYLKYKGVAFDWVPRTQGSEAELKALSRFPTLPVLVTASGFAVHDTTPMMEALEADSPEPSATPGDPAVAFLACVLEEYADAWLAKAAYHYRWTRKRDQRLAAARAIDDYYAAEPPADRKAAEDAAIEAMLGQMKLMGLDGELGSAVEKSFKRFVKLLDDHLRKHLCLFGGRPSIADFAIAGQLIQMMKDPTPAKIIEKDGEFVAKWCEFLQDAQPSGPFEALEDLKETLAPLFADELATFFLPWAAENLESHLAGHDSFEVALGKETFRLAPLRSAARSFRELRRKFVSGQAIESLKAFTDEAGCTVYLLRPQRPDHRPEAQPPGDDPLAGTDEDALAADGEGEDEAAHDTHEDGEGGRRRRRRRRRGRGRGEQGALEAVEQEEEAGREAAAAYDAVEEGSGEGVSAEPRPEAAAEPPADPEASASAESEPASRPEAATDATDVPPGTPADEDGDEGETRA